MRSETDPIPRPPSCPSDGQVPSFDAGWNAHRVGLSRSTVEYLAGIGCATAQEREQVRDWVVLGYDIRRTLSINLLGSGVLSGRTDAFPMFSDACSDGTKRGRMVV